MRLHVLPGGTADALEVQAARLIGDLGIEIAVDVGANIGQYGLALRAAGYEGRILSFEPVGASFRKLERLCRFDDRWTCHRYALGAHRGKGEIRVTRASLLSSFRPPADFAQRTFQSAAEVVRTEDVEIRRLDEILPELLGDHAGARLFLKMDTQGYDLEVLAGAEGLLEQVDVLQTELSMVPLYDDAPDYLETLRHCRELGFEPVGFFPIFLFEPSKVIAECDCLLARNPEPDRAPAIELMHDQFEVSPPISVLVVTCVDSPGLRNALTAVRQQARPLSAEIVLVVNGPTASLSDESTTTLRALCDQLVFEPQVGKSHALNRGVRACRGEVIAFTDDDAEPQSGWLEAITAPLLRDDRQPELVGCGGRVLPVYAPGGVPSWYRKLVAGQKSYFLGPIHDLGDDVLEYAPPDDDRGAPLGANCAYLREIFGRYGYHPALGPNRETGLRGGEDYELAFRLLLDGYRITYEPRAVVKHPVASERTTLEYVTRGYHLQGIENARLREMLDLPLPTRKWLRKKIRRRTLGQSWRRWLDPVRYRTRMMRIERMRGQLDELDRQAVSVDWWRPPTRAQRR